MSRTPIQPNWMFVNLITIFDPAPVRWKVSAIWTVWNLKILITKKVLILRWSLFWKGGFRNNIESAYFKDGFKVRQGGIIHVLDFPATDPTRTVGPDFILSLIGD